MPSPVKRATMNVMATTDPAMSTPASRHALASLLCDILPPQGAWSDEAYLWLTDHSRRPIELTDGCVEELPVPTDTHQAILAFLYRLFHHYLRPRGGVVMFSALRMRIREGKFREPDLLALRDRSDPRRQDRYWLGADLVAEVVSPDDPGRDLVGKRVDYAEGAIPEYWIVDPRDETDHGARARGGRVCRARGVRAWRGGHIGASGRLQGRCLGGVRRSEVGPMSTGRSDVSVHRIRSVRRACRRRGRRCRRRSG